MSDVTLADATKSVESDAGETVKPQIPIKSKAEHVLKTTAVGRPFQKDAADLFATFVAAIDLKPHKVGFRTVQNSFTTEEARQTLALLKLSQSSRTLDPKNPAVFITTTTNFVFSMDSCAAMNLCQHFMDARYLQNAADPSVPQLKDKGLYTVTPKGLHILERFMEKTGIDADRLKRLLNTEVVCSKIFQVLRDPTEDEIVFPRMDLHALFRWFVGPRPNYLPKSMTNLDLSIQHAHRAQGVPLADLTYRGFIGKGVQHKYCFDASDALEWLCDFTSVIGRDEAAQVGAHFTRLGLVQLVGNSDKLNKIRNAAVPSATSSEGEKTAKPQNEFHCVNKAIYQVTPKGFRVAGWTDCVTDDYCSEKDAEDDVDEQKSCEAKKLASATDRLLRILREQSYRSLFHEYLRETLCEEHILFWMDVEAITRRFHIMSIAIGGADVAKPDPLSATQIKTDCRKHHQTLLQKAQLIWKTYLEPYSQYELNTDYSLRSEVAKFLETIPAESQGKELDRASRITYCNAEQLQTLIQHFQRIQAHTFRVMVTDSLPKFLETERYITLRDASHEIETPLTPTDTPDVDGMYINYSSLIA